MSRMDINDTTYEAFIFLKAMAGAVSIAFPERVHRVVIGEFILFIYSFFLFAHGQSD